VLIRSLRHCRKSLLTSPRSASQGPRVVPAREPLSLERLSRRSLGMLHSVSFVFPSGLGQLEKLCICCCSIFDYRHLNISQGDWTAHNIITRESRLPYTTRSSGNSRVLMSSSSCTSPSSTSTNTFLLQSRTIRAPRHRTPPQQQGQARAQAR